MSNTHFRILAGTPPKTVRTFDDWKAWRKQENERMLQRIMAHMRTLCDDEQWLAETEDAMRWTLDQQLRDEQNEGGLLH